ncbi:MAG: hypothetical protein H0U24_01445 [Thermoleophilaceae bacterium]|nr:hypothetical protein [Thermoleophilaceae bacterium]
MKHTALDIWDDLREKRLWPVAVALLLAVIAIPVIVMKPTEEAPPAVAQPATPQAQGTPAVAAADSPDSSTLGLFGKKDPFRPPAAVLKPSVSSAPDTGASKAGPSPSPPASGGAPATSGSAPAPPSGSGGSGPTGGGSAPSSSPVAKRPSTVYTYVIDMDFGRVGHVRLRRGLPRLTILPNERSPVAVLLGVSAGARRAVFLLNRSFQQGGEGTCRPSRATCTFLHLSTDPKKNGHRIVDDKGVTYVLRLRAIRRVTVREAARASRRSARASAGRGSREGNFPVFADEQR